MVANLLVAGHDTTTSQLGGSLLVVLANRSEAASALTDRGVLSSVVSETTRLEPGIPVIPRSAAEPLEVDGQEIPAGRMVMLCSVTANRDPAVWKDPDRFDAARFTLPGTPHLLSFGAGPHYCLGTALAKVNLEECIRAVLAHEAQLELAEPADQVPWRVMLGRSPERVLVTAGA